VGKGKLIFLLPRSAAIYRECGATSDVFSVYAGTCTVLSTHEHSITIYSMISMGNPGWMWPQSLFNNEEMLNEVWFVVSESAKGKVYSVPLTKCYKWKNRTDSPDTVALIRRGLIQPKQSRTAVPEFLVIFVT
jgi:hypothetical protein